MNKYRVIIDFVYDDKPMHIIYDNVETISYGNEFQSHTISNDKMLTAKIPLGNDLLLQGAQNNASVKGANIISIRVQ